MSISFAQNLTDDLKQVMGQMLEAKSISIKVKVDAYSKKGGYKLFSSPASLKKFDNSTLSLLDRMEVLRTPDYEVKIDHSRKAVLIVDRKALKIPELDLDEMDLRKLQKFVESHSEKENVDVKLVSENPANRVYEILGSQRYQSVFVALDLVNNRIRKISYEYNDRGNPGQYVVLTYNEFDYNKDLSDQLEVKNYFQTVNNKYVLSAKLKGYKLYTEE